MLLIPFPGRVHACAGNLYDDLFSNQQIYKVCIKLLLLLSNTEVIKMGEGVTRHHFYDTIRIRISEGLKQG